MTKAEATAIVQLDEPHVRVTEYRFPPGSSTGWHRHDYDYVVVPIVPGTLTMQDAAGERRQATLVFGQSYARLAGVEHDVLNESDAEVAFIEIEMKR
ncbi:MAG: cupin domain-containing protein [Pseudomonadota bacterium]